MKTFELKYGCNPNQKPASLYMHDGVLPSSLCRDGTVSSIMPPLPAVRTIRLP